MDFGYSPAQRALFARMQRLGETVQALDESERMAALAREGVLGLSIPADRGGGGLDLVSTACAFEGLGWHLDAGLLLAAGAHLFGVAMTIARVGTEAQRARFLPVFARGELIASVAATEHDAGSDVSAVSSTLVRDGEGFLARGEKRYVTFADRADVFFWLGRRPGDRGLTVALVERGPGVSPADLYETAGLRGARLGPVSFADAVVPAGNVIGKPGAGMVVFQLAMCFERALVLAFRLGAMQRQLDEAVAFARRRKVGGKRIAEHQAVSHRIVAMKARLESARLLTHKAAAALDAGERAHAESALAKWCLAEAAVDNALDAIRLRGGAAILRDEGHAAVLDDALGGTMHSGTRDVLADIIAGWLGL
jgi:alkylation response protein AidB-like acyl-CoA dehydrogenase